MTITPYSKIYIYIYHLWQKQCWNYKFHFPMSISYDLITLQNQSFDRPFRCLMIGKHEKCGKLWLLFPTQRKIVIFPFPSGEMSFELIMIYAGLMWDGAEPDTLISRQIECFSTKFILFPLFFFKLSLWGFLFHYF